MTLDEEEKLEASISRYDYIAHLATGAGGAGVTIMVSTVGIAVITEHVPPAPISLTTAITVGVEFVIGATASCIGIYASRKATKLAAKLRGHAP
jgi:hypothetical protein